MKYPPLFSIFFLMMSLLAYGKTQDDFMKGQSEVYANASDSYKAIQLAKNLYDERVVNREP